MGAVLEEQELAGVLKLTRQMAELSQEYMARRCKCSQSMIAMVENGEREPSLRMLRIWAEETKHEALVSLVGGAYIGRQDESELVEIVSESVRYKIAFDVASGGRR